MPAIVSLSDIYTFTQWTLFTYVVAKMLPVLSRPAVMINSAITLPDNIQEYPSEVIQCIFAQLMFSMVMQSIQSTLLKEKIPEGSLIMSRLKTGVSKVAMNNLVYSPLLTVLMYYCYDSVVNAVKDIASMSPAINSTEEEADFDYSIPGVFDAISHHAFTAAVICGVAGPIILNQLSEAPDVVHAAR